MGGMGDFKKWRGDLSNGEDDFEMGGQGSITPLRTMTLNKNITKNPK